MTNPAQSSMPSTHFEMTIGYNRLKLAAFPAEERPRVALAAKRRLREELMPEATVARWAELDRKVSEKIELALAGLRAGDVPESVMLDYRSDDVQASIELLAMVVEEPRYLALERLVNRRLKEAHSGLIVQGVEFLGCRVVGNQWSGQACFNLKKDGVEGAHRVRVSEPTQTLPELDLTALVYVLFTCSEADYEAIFNSAQA